MADVAVEDVVEIGERGVAIRVVGGLDFVEHVGMTADRALAVDHHAAREDVGAFDGDVDRRGLEAACHRIAGPEHDGLAGVDIHRILGDVLGHGGDVIFGDRGGHGRFFAQIDRVRCKPAHGFAGIGLAADPCEGFLNALERADGDIELTAHDRIGAGQARVGDRIAGRAGRQRDGTADRQALHEHPPALADHVRAADDGVERHEHVGTPGRAVLERRAGGEMPAPAMHAGGVGGNQCTGHPEFGLAAEQSVRVVHLEGEPEHGRYRRERDIAFLPGEFHAQDLFAVPFALADDAPVGNRARVGARMGAGQAETGDFVAHRESRQVVVFLRFGAVVHQQFGRPQRVGHCDDRPDGAAGRTATDLGQHAGMRIRREFQPAIALGDDHAPETVFLDELPGLGRKIGVFVRDLPFVAQVQQLLDRAVEKRLFFCGKFGRGQALEPTPVRRAGEHLAFPPDGAGIQRGAFGGRERRQYLAKDIEHRTRDVGPAYCGHVERNRDGEKHQPEHEASGPAGAGERAGGQQQGGYGRGGLEPHAVVGQRDECAKEHDDPDDCGHDKAPGPGQTGLHRTLTAA